MKYVLILGDGMADYSVPELGGKTPLETADKPCMDELARLGEVGLVKTIPAGMKPGSDTANLSVMGYDPVKYYTGRSPLEAISMGIEMISGDIAVRTNLVTLSDEADFNEKTMVDYSAGEISTAEARTLVRYIDKKLGDDVMRFYGGVSYRHCLIVHKSRLGTDLTPPHDISGKKVGKYLPKGLHGGGFTELIKKSYELLNDHPVNLKRIAEGKRPANCIWLWGEGVKPFLPSFESLYGLKGAVISAVDLLKGLGIAAGMKIYNVKGATGTLATNFTGKANACIKALKEGADFVYLHIEATDECSHQGDLEGKLKAISLIDKKVLCKVLSGLKKMGGEYSIMVLPDHPTPLCTRTHASDPVPYLIYRSGGLASGNKGYNEKEAQNSRNFLDSGMFLMQRFIKG